MRLIFFNANFLFFLVATLSIKCRLGQSSLVRIILKIREMKLRYVVYSSFRYYISIYISKVKLAIVVEGDPKAPLSIATTPWCKEGRYSFSWVAPLYLWFVPYNAMRHQVPFFESLVWLDLRLNPGLPGHWRTLYALLKWKSPQCSCLRAWLRHWSKCIRTTPLSPGYRLNYTSTVLL